MDSVVGNESTHPDEEHRMLAVQKMELRLSDCLNAGRFINKARTSPNHGLENERIDFSYLSSIITRSLFSARRFYP